MTMITFMLEVMVLTLIQCAGVVTVFVTLTVTHNLWRNLWK
jgi:hypothetical protein